MRILGRIRDLKEVTEQAGPSCSSGTQASSLEQGPQSANKRLHLQEPLLGNFSRPQHCLTICPQISAPLGKRATSMHLFDPLPPFLHLITRALATAECCPWLLFFCWFSLWLVSLWLAVFMTSAWIQSCLYWKSKQILIREATGKRY